MTTPKEIHGMPTDTVLEAYYLDWFNSYLTIAVYCLDHDLTEVEGRALIELGRMVHTRLTYDKENAI